MEQDEAPAPAPDANVPPVKPLIVKLTAPQSEKIARYRALGYISVDGTAFTRAAVDDKLREVAEAARTMEALERDLADDAVPAGRAVQAKPADVRRKR